VQGMLPRISCWGRAEASGEEAPQGMGLHCPENNASFFLLLWMEQHWVAHQLLLQGEGDAADSAEDERVAWEGQRPEGKYGVTLGGRLP
jgi:hypothetical protein